MENQLQAMANRLIKKQEELDKAASREGALQARLNAAQMKARQAEQDVSLKLLCQQNIMVMILNYQPVLQLRAYQHNSDKFDLESAMKRSNQSNNRRDKFEPISSLQVFSRLRSVASIGKMSVYDVYYIMLTY